MIRLNEKSQLYVIETIVVPTAWELAVYCRRCAKRTVCLGPFAVVSTSLPLNIIRSFVTRKVFVAFIHRDM